MYRLYIIYITIKMIDMGVKIFGLRNMLETFVFTSAS